MQNLIFTFKIANNWLEKDFNIPFTAETLESAQKLAEDFVDSFHSLKVQVYNEKTNKVVDGIQIKGITNIQKAA